MTLTFGVDFDDTFTADPDLHIDLMTMLMDRGHLIVVVTRRGDHHRPKAVDVINKAFGEGVIEVVKCRGRFKRQAAKEAGYSVDIWWDDYPWSIDGPKKP